MNEKQQKRMLDMLKTFEGSAVLPEELAQIIGVLVEVIKSVKDNLNVALDNIGSKSATDIKDVLAKLGGSQTKLEKMISDNRQLSATETARVMKDCLKEIKRVESSMPTMPDLSELENKINSIRIPTIEEISLDLPKLGNRIRDGLELLQGEERLDKKAVKGLDDYDEISKLARQPKGTSYTGLSGIKEIVAGSNITVDNSNLGYPVVSASGGALSDEKVKYDIADPTAGYIADKFVAGTGISVAEGAGANENKLVITNSNPTPYTLPTATDTVLGGIKVGATLGIVAGVLNYTNPNPTPYTLPTATGAVKGGVIIGSRLTMTGDTLSADVQSTTVTGTALDNVWSSNGILVRTGVATYGVITDNHTNWDSAYSAIHAAVTLDTNADDILSLTTQALGLQTQAANTVWAGRVSAGTALVPTFRALVALDIPDLSGTYLTSVTAHNLLSTTHGDTTAAACARGSIIVGDVNTKWVNLAFPATPTGKVLIATATDVAWSASALGTAAYTASTAYAAALAGTINEIAYFNSTTTIASLAVATYPSLTELAFVKGLTSSAQTQITAKMTNPMTTGGDLIYGGASGVATRLANGSAGQVLTSAGTTLAPTWTTPTVYETAGAVSTHAALITGVHGLVFTAGKALTLTESLTLNALPVGGLAVATSANTLGSLAVGLTTQVLVGGGAATVPAWTTDLPTALTIGTAYIYRVSGTDVAVADGGTGLGTIADGSVLATNAADTLSAITWHSAGTKVLTNTSGTISWETAAGGGANTALSNLASVAINLSLTSDTDITDDLGTGDIRWKDIHAATLNSGLTATDTLKLRGYDVNGTAYVDVLTITSADTVTADLNALVTRNSGKVILDADHTALQNVHGLAITAGQTLTVTTGGTIGSAAYTASTDYATAAQGTLATNAMPKGGGTFTGNVLFTDNTLDIGASGATRPRTGYFGTSLIVGSNASVLGSVKLFGNTSGDVTLQPNAIAGTGIVLTLPAVAGTLLTTASTASALTSGGATFTVTTGYKINGAATANTILKGNGTNFVQSTETYAAPGTSGNVMTSDGTNWTSAALSAATAAGVQNMSYSYAADAGSTDAYAITLSPAPAAYAVGQMFLFKANTVNTGAATLNVNTLGAITIKKGNNADLATNDIRAGQMALVTYNASSLSTDTSNAEGTDENLGNSGGKYIKLSQSFTATLGGILDSIIMNLKNSTGATGNATISIYAHTGTYGTSSLPTGSALASYVLDVSTIPSGFTNMTLTFAGANRIALTQGTYYEIVIEYSGVSLINVRYSTSGGTGSGNWGRYVSSWEAVAAADMDFTVNVMYPRFEMLSPIQQ